MKYGLGLIAWLTIFLPVFAQQSTKIDSLQALLQTVPADRDTGHINRRAQLNLQLSNAHGRPVNDYAAMRRYGRQALSLYAATRHERGQARALENIAFAHLFQSHTPEATDTFLLSLGCWETLRDTGKMSYILSTLAGHYTEISGQTDRAIAYSKRCVEIAAAARRLHGWCACSHLLGDLYDKIGQADSATFYLQQALHLAEQMGNQSDKSTLFLALARVEDRKGHYDAAQHWLAQAEDVFHKYPDQLGSDHQLNLYLYQAQNSLHRGDLAKASRYLSACPAWVERQKDWAYSMRYFGLMSELAEKQGRTAEALAFFKRHIDARDSLNNIEQTRRLTEIQLQHEFARKQAAEEASQQRELALRDARSRQQRLLFLLVFVGLLIASAAGFYIIRQKQNRRRTELELANLRAQINPHFIFNCLNSIYRYTKERDTDTAAKYLQKFSSLLRLVLENSRSERVTLARDLEALQLYVDIESLRFKEKLNWSLYIDANIDPGFVQIPGMLIQPHVENAIWHGLMHRETGGNIRVHITQPDEALLRVVIEDDGIGRAAAAEIESKSALTKKSLGQKITAERLKATGKLARMETVDLYDDQQKPAGTRVVMEIVVN